MEQEGLRLSTFLPNANCTLSSFRAALGACGGEDGSAGPMACVSDLELMQESIQVLINNCLDQDDVSQISVLFELQWKITEALEEYAKSTPQRQEADATLPAAGDSSSSMPSDKSREKEEEKEEEEDKEEKEEKEESEEVDGGALAGMTDAEFLMDDSGPAHWVVYEEFECPICICDIPPEEGYREACGHAYCRECLSMFLKVKVESGDVIDIKCPDPTCGNPVLVYDIAELVDEELFTKFQNLSLLQCLKQDPDARWCPWEGCDNVILAESDVASTGQGTRVSCSECLRPMCIDCSQMWHTGATCLEYQKKQEPDDKRTKKWKKRNNIKACPHCGAETLKISGCPDMKCANCKKAWNWYYDEAQKWSNSGLSRLDETQIEKAAFVYPRLFKQAIGSRELRENPEERRDILLGLGIFGLAGVPVTVVAMPPALTIKAGRKMKRSFSSISRRMKKDAKKGSDQTDDSPAPGGKDTPQRVQ